MKITKKTTAVQLKKFLVELLDGVVTADQITVVARDTYYSPAFSAFFSEEATPACMNRIASAIKEGGISWSDKAEGLSVRSSNELMRFIAEIDVWECMLTLGQEDISHHFPTESMAILNLMNSPESFVPGSLYPGLTEDSFRFYVKRKATGEHVFLEGEQLVSYFGGLPSLKYQPAKGVTLPPCPRVRHEGMSS